MRTTVNIDEGLLETAKSLAAEKGVTLGDLLEASLQHYLGLPAEPSAGPPIPVFRGGSGPAPGVDLTTNAGLYDAMDAEDPEHP